MKKVKNVLLTLIITLSFTVLLAQAPPPPNGGSDAGGGNTAVGNGGGAPIGGGLFILLGLGMAYGGKKLYNMRKEELED